MAKPIFTAIVFMLDQSAPRKYRNISNVITFVKFAISIKAHYINLYDKSTKFFVRRIYINYTKKGT
jgi:hypothetical protein